MIRYTYDNRDNLLALTDPKNNTYRFEYDKRNLKTKEIRPLRQAITYVYDASGYLTSRTDSKGQVRKYAYDDASRRVSETHHGNATAAASKSIAYTYNAVGTLTGYNDGVTSATYAVDSNQRKLSETVNYDTFTLVNSYTYYANQKKKTYTGSDGVTQSYTYDNNNQLAGIALPVGSITYTGYQWQFPTAITLPGGTTKQYTYDPLQRLATINVKDPGQNPVMNYQYTYDKADNITQIGTEQGNRTYGYDTLYRLTQATIQTFATESYTYDPAHNRATDSQAGTIAYDGNNALTQYGDATFAYDDNGNTIQKIQGTAVTGYVYDASDRLVGVKDNNTNGTIATYYYDPFGKRLSKEVNGIKTYYFYSDEGLTSEHDAQGNLTVAYGYLPDSTFTTNPVFQKNTNTTTNISSYYFYHNDHLGTPQKMTDAQGAIVWSATYAAFGRTTAVSAGGVANNLRFPGQYEDGETGLHYNWNRYYDPENGRYILPDLVGVGTHIQQWLSDSGIDGSMANLEGSFSIANFRSAPLELNPYVYTANNPLRWTDPTGLNIVRVGAAAMAICMKIKRCKEAVERAVKFCKNVECRFERHNAHHPFPGKGWCEHYSLVCWEKGGGQIFRAQWPFPGRCVKDKPRGPLP